jgi:hypothetical protein
MVVFLFGAAGSVFADMDPQRFYTALNLILSMAAYATIQVQDVTQDDIPQDELLAGDENKDGYIYSAESISLTLSYYLIISVKHRKTVVLFLSNDPNFPELAKKNGDKVYGNIGKYSNLKEQLIKDFDAERAKIGIRSRSTSSTIN